MFVKDDRYAVRISAILAGHSATNSAFDNFAAIFHTNEHVIQDFDGPRTS